MVECVICKSEVEHPETNWFKLFDVIQNAVSPGAIDAMTVKRHWFFCDTHAIRGAIIESDPDYPDGPWRYRHKNVQQPIWLT